MKDRANENALANPSRATRTRRQIKVGPYVPGPTRTCLPLLVRFTPGIATLCGSKLVEAAFPCLPSSSLTLQLAPYMIERSLAYHAVFFPCACLPPCHCSHPGACSVICCHHGYSGRTALSATTALCICHCNLVENIVELPCFPRLRFKGLCPAIGKGNRQHDCM